MSNTSSGKNLQTGSVTLTTVPSGLIHPQYDYWKDEWVILRDCVVGELEIKRKGADYLPKMAGQDNDEYKTFLQNATFFSMTARTVNGLLGTVFMRPVQVQEMPKRLNKGLEAISKDNHSLNTFAKLAGQEMITVGRYGSLLDMDDSGKYDPYITGYITENILNWEVDAINGRNVLTEVLLREIVDTRKGVNSAPVDSNSRFVANYRILKLVPYEQEDGSIKRQYEQHVYHPRQVQAGGGRTAYAPPDFMGEPNETIIPTNRGVPFDFIPFVFFGPWTNDPDIDKPPLLDIARLNISHYRSYAQLEHGRFYTAMPLYYTFIGGAVNKEGGGDYTLGPNVVWEVEGDKAPGVVEYHGHGLNFLENALEAKEHQISSLGGRMLGVQTNAVSESDNVVALKERNERSLLLNVTTILSEGLTTLVQWWAIWQDVSEAKADKIKVEVNQDFLRDNSAAREFRAISQMFKEGQLPVTIFYDFFRKSEIIHSSVSLEEFTAMLEDPKQFPNQADAIAMQDGYPSAQAKLDEEMAEKELEAMPTDPQASLTTSFNRQEEAKKPAPKKEQPAKEKTDDKTKTK